MELDKDLNINELSWLSVWCRQYGVDFGHVYLIEAVNNPNPVKEIDPDRLNFADNAGVACPSFGIAFFTTFLIRFIVVFFLP